MERVAKSSTPFFRKQLDHVRVEFHLQGQSGGFFIVPYVCLNTLPQPYVKTAQLKGIPSSGSFDQLDQVGQVLRNAVVLCRDYLDYPLVEVVPKGLGGMKSGGFGGLKPGFLNPKSGNKSCATAHERTARKRAPNLRSQADDAAVPSNSNNSASSSRPPDRDAEGARKGSSGVDNAVVMRVEAAINQGLVHYRIGEVAKAMPLWGEALVLARQSGDRRLEGRASGHLGLACRCLGRYSQAIALHKRDLEIAREYDDRHRLGGAYCDLGNVYQFKGNFHKAIEFHEQHLAVTRELADYSGEGRAHGNLGNAYHCLGRYSDAIGSLSKYLFLAEKMQDLAGQATACSGLGIAHSSSGNQREAARLHSMHLEIARRLGDAASEQKAFNNLGIAHRGLGEYRTAIDCHNYSLELAERLEDVGGKGSAYAGLGAAYQRLGKYELAMEYHEKHLAVSKQVGDRAEWGTALCGIGAASRSLGNYVQAIEYFERSLTLARDRDNYAGMAKVYNNLGATFHSLGEFRKAIEYHTKCLKINRQLEDQAAEGEALGNLGDAYHSLGEYGRALEYHNCRLEMARKLEDRPGEGSAYAGLGNACQKLGQHRKALEFYHKDLAVAEALASDAAKAVAYGNLGNAYNRLGEHAKAIEFHQRQLAIVVRLGDRFKEAGALNNLGVAYRDDGNLVASEQHFRQAVACFGALQEGLGAENQSWQISIFEEQSKSYLQLKDVVIALERTSEALSLVDFGRSRALISFLSRERVEGAKKPLLLEEIRVLAARHGTTFVQYSFHYSDPNILYAWTVSPEGEITFHKLRGDMLPPLDVSDSLSALAPFAIPQGCQKGLEAPPNLTEARDDLLNYPLDIDDLSEVRDEVAPHETHSSIPTAYETRLEKANTTEEKFAILLYLTRRCQARGEWRSLHELALRLRTLSEEHSKSESHLTGLIFLAMAKNALHEGEEALSFSEEARALALQREDRRSEGHALRERALAHHLTSRHETAVSLAKEALRLAEECEDLVGEGMAYRVLGRIAVEAGRINSQDRPSNSNNPRADIPLTPSRSDAVNCLSRAVEMANAQPNLSERMEALTWLAQAYEQVDQQGEALFSWYQALKIAKELNLAQNVVEISGACGSLISGLRLQTNQRLSKYYNVLIAPLEQHLVDDSRITIVPDSSLNTLPFSIFRDPNGNYLLERYTVSMVPSMEVLREIDSVEGRAPPIQPALIVGDPQENLVYSAWEAKKLGELFETRPLIGSEATPSAVIQGARDARFLHLSCHGSASYKTHPNSVFEGALALANGETTPAWWNAEEIQKLPLRAELAFLSACKSGRGRLQKEGVIGLARSFLAAGVPTVIATHWSIPESSCAVNMTEEFYSHLLRKSPQSQEFEGELGKADLLRQVMDDLLRDNPRLKDYPEKWGAFFLLGRP